MWHSLIFPRFFFLFFFFSFFPPLFKRANQSPFNSKHQPLSAHSLSSIKPTQQLPRATPLAASITNLFFSYSVSLYSFSLHGFHRLFNSDDQQPTQARPVNCPRCQTGPLMTSAFDAPPLSCSRDRASHASSWSFFHNSPPARHFWPTWTFLESSFE